MNLFKIPAYFINMDERPDRLKRFMAQKTTRDLNLHRVKAINGKAIKNYMADKRISLRTRFNIYRNYRRSHHEIATLGAIGASLSHISVWKRFVASEEPYCLIFEDDAIISEDSIRKAQSLWSTLPEWGIWLLGYYASDMVTERLHGKWSKVYVYNAAHAYILKREAAIKLLEDALPIEMHIDHYMSMCGIMKGFNVVQHLDLNVPFWTVANNAVVTDSNTAQHKKNGCTVCDVPDDYSQLYREYSNAGPRGRTVKGVIRGQQSSEIRTMHTRKMSRSNKNV